MLLRRIGLFFCVALLLFVMGCQQASRGANQQGDAAANQQRDTAVQQAGVAKYQKVTYANASKKGPQVVVLPGVVKSMNADFTKQFSPASIADFAEVELANANFQVLERHNLGDMLKEIEVAVNLGDMNTVKKFKKGRMQATNWFIRFDIIKAAIVQKEEHAHANNLAGTIVGGILGAAISAKQSGGKSETWLIGLRYTVLDVNTGQQVATDYLEDTMTLSAEVHKSINDSQAVLNGDGGPETIVQRLIQQAVQRIDELK